MDNRFVFRYNNNYVVDRLNQTLDYYKCPRIDKLPANEYWYAGGYDDGQDMVNDLNLADVAIIPYTQWEDYQKNKIGIILEVEVNIQLNEKANEYYLNLYGD